MLAAGSDSSSEDEDGDHDEWSFQKKRGSLGEAAAAAASGTIEPEYDEGEVGAVALLS